MRLHIVGILYLLFTMTRTLANPDVEIPDDTYSDTGIDGKINDFVQPISEWFAKVVFCYFTVNGVEIPFILVWLIVAAVFVTIYFQFISIRGINHGLDLVRGKFFDPTAEGDLTHFQALSTAVSGTVGLGNISGVAIAITVGGPGATFWMIIAGLLGMSLKFAECTLGVKYRKVNPDGSISGGPMYYLERGLDKNGCWLWCGKLGKFLGGLFCVFCIGGSWGGGNMFQANQSFSQLVNVCGGHDGWLADKGWAFGILFAIIVGSVIIGGVKRIAVVTSTVVPIMGAIYVFSGLLVILINITSLPDAVRQIFKGAFKPEGISGGFLGVLFQGFRRAAFSNEAGIGSAPIAHSAVKTNIPVTEGFVALFEPFIDTVVVCTITALVIVITGYWQSSIDSTSGVQLTSDAFASTIPWYPYVLTFAGILFAFSTMLSWSYYGLKSWTFLFGENRIADISYKVLFLLFVIVGSSINLDSVIDFTDAMIFCMSIPNIFGLYVMLSTIKRDLDSYWGDYRSGKLRKMHKRNDTQRTLSECSLEDTESENHSINKEVSRITSPASANEDSAVVQAPLSEI